MRSDDKQLDGRYIVREVIGSGGFGAVYLAEDTRFGGDNQVAVKKTFHTDEKITQSFRQEADLLFKLSHPNLPKVTNCFQEDGANFLVMDFISGEDLSEQLKRGQKFSVEEVLEIADTILDALEYLHSFKVYHRDIKPHNIKIDDSGKIFLIDFGTAKGNLDKKTFTQATGQSVIGFTPFYAPIEQIIRNDVSSYLLLQSVNSPDLEKLQEHKTDGRSDIYCLGATLYHLLTGFASEEATAPVRAHAVWSGKSDPLPDCQKLNPVIPDQLAMILERSLELIPKDRFQTVLEMRGALNELSRGSITLERPKLSEPAEGETAHFQVSTKANPDPQTRPEFPRSFVTKDQKSKETVLRGPASQKTPGAGWDRFDSEKEIKTIAKPPQKRSTARPILIFGFLVVILLGLFGLAGGSFLLVQNGILEFEGLPGLFEEDKKDEEDSGEKDPGEEKKNVKTTDASKSEIPSEKELQKMVRADILRFDRAIKDEDFSDFYDNISDLWQEQTTPKKLKKVFQSFIDGNANLSEIRDLKPTFSPKPRIDDFREIDILIVKGTYPTEPRKSNFELKYIAEDKSWKLIGFYVKTTVY